MSAKNKMVNAGLLFLVALLFFVFVSEDTEAATYTVDEFGGSDYTNITQAVENASAGDTIKVASRTYHDNVEVNKKLTITGGNYGVNLEHLYDCHFDSGDLVAHYSFDENGGSDASDGVWCNNLDGDELKCVWKGKSSSGNKVANGIYFCKISAEGQIFWEKLGLVQFR